MSQKKEAPRVLYGILEFFSETGTEGGYWAFQDERFIQHNVPRGWCKKCGKWLAYKPKTDDEIDPKWCPEGQHEEEFGEAWSYDGLHILRNGDLLTILQPLVWGIPYYSRHDPTAVVWRGRTKLKKHKLFTEHAFGFWIHNDQVGEQREKWAIYFFEHYPARLILSKDVTDEDLA